MPPFSLQCRSAVRIWSTPCSVVPIARRQDAAGTGHVQVPRGRSGFHRVPTSVGPYAKLPTQNLTNDFIVAGLGAGVGVVLLLTTPGKKATRGAYSATPEARFVRP